MSAAKESIVATLAQLLGPEFDALFGDRTSAFLTYLANAEAIRSIFGEPGGDIVYDQARAAMEAPRSRTTLIRALSMPGHWFRYGTTMVDTVEADLRKVAQIVERGFQMGRGPLDVARDLQKVIGLDSRRMDRLDKWVDKAIAAGVWTPQAEERERKRLLRERAEMVARTEMSFAAQSGNRSQAQERGVRYMAWRTRADDRVSDYCRAQEAKGFIKITENFDGGRQAPPGHPNCRCHLVFASDKAIADKIDKALQKHREQTGIFDARAEALKAEKVAKKAAEKAAKDAAKAAAEKAAAAAAAAQTKDQAWLAQNKSGAQVVKELRQELSQHMVYDHEFRARLELPESRQWKPSVHVDDPDGDYSTPERDMIKTWAEAVGRHIDATGWQTPKEEQKIRVFWDKTKYGKDRAYMRRGAGGPAEMNLPPDSYNLDEWVFWHEVGHHVETNARVNALTKKMLYDRGAGASAQKLKDVTGYKSYKDDEVCLAPERWMTPYCAKLYNWDSSEVISMGLQMFFQDPIDFATKDPEHFALTYDVLHGRYSQ